MNHKSFKSTSTIGITAMGLRVSLAMVAITLLCQFLIIKVEAKPYESMEAAATADDRYDENFEIIPVMSGDQPKTIGEHLSERAKEIAESFSQMWQSLANTIKNAVDGIRQLFEAGEDFQLTPEEEKQWRAAMEAQGIAIEERNEILRNTYENQL